MNALWKAVADVTVNEAMTCHNDQEQFLTNEHNKSQFISLLIPELAADGHEIKQGSGDADTLIVPAAIELISNGQHVIIADNTNIVFFFCSTLSQKWKRFSPKSQKNGLRKVSMYVMLQNQLDTSNWFYSITYDVWLFLVSSLLKPGAVVTQHLSSMDMQNFYS